MFSFHKRENLLCLFSFSRLNSSVCRCFFLLYILYIRCVRVFFIFVEGVRGWLSFVASGIILQRLKVFCYFSINIVAAQTYRAATNSPLKAHNIKRLKWGFRLLHVYLCVFTYLLRSGGLSKKEKIKESCAKPCYLIITYNDKVILTPRRHNNRHTHNILYSKHFFFFLVFP